MWLTSSTKEVLAVTDVDGKPFAGGVPGPVFRRMRALFQAHKPKPVRPLGRADARYLQRRAPLGEAAAVEHERGALAPRSQDSTSPMKSM